MHEEEKGLQKEYEGSDLSVGIIEIAGGEKSPSNGAGVGGDVVLKSKRSANKLTFQESGITLKPLKSFPSPEPVSKTW